MRSESVERAAAPRGRAASSRDWTFAALGALVGFAGVLLLLAAAAVLALGAFGARHELFDAIANLRPKASFLALAAGGLLLGAGWRRLATAACLVGLAGLAALGSAAWAGWRPLDAEAAAAAGFECRIEPFRVAIANVESSSPRFAETLASLQTIDADLLATVESRDPSLRSAPGLLRRFPHRLDEGGAVLWADRPIVPPDFGPPARLRPMPTFALGVVQVGGREIGVAVVHMDRPLVGRQREELANLDALFEGLPPDRIVLGDFNAAPWSHAMAEVERAAGVRRTPGFRVTWRGVWPDPLFGTRLRSIFGAQIDHVLISPGFGVRRVTTAPLPGSVHEAVIADLDIPSAGCRTPL